MKFGAVLACSLFFLCAPATADEEPVRVERGILEVTVEAKGRFEPLGGRSVLLAPAAWRGRYVVTHAVRPGTIVEAGEVVLRFDDRALKDAVESAKGDLDFARREAEIAEVRRRHAAETAAEGLERREHELALARVRFEAYRDVALVNSRRQSELDDKSHVFGLENAREELAQLERMYSEDELVDETEQIVIRRARWDVKNREARLMQRRARREYSEKYEEAPHLEALRRDLEAKKAGFVRAEAEGALAERTRRIAEERSRLALREKERNLTRLARDLTGMIVRAPGPGMLLHGAAEGSLGKRFSIGQQVNPAEPVVTIVQASDLVAVLSVAEEWRLDLEAGQASVIRPASKSAEAISGQVVAIGPFAQNGKHRIEVRVEPPASFELAGAGLSGSVVVKRLRNVLLVPLDRVMREAGKTYCRISGDGGPRKVEVTLGPTDGTHVQILGGLSEGDVLAGPEGAR